MFSDFVAGNITTGSHYGGGGGGGGTGSQPARPKAVTPAATAPPPPPASQQDSNQLGANLELGELGQLTITNDNESAYDVSQAGLIRP